MPVVLQNALPHERHQQPRRRGTPAKAGFRVPINFRLFRRDEVRHLNDRARGRRKVKQAKSCCEGEACHPACFKLSDAVFDGSGRVFRSQVYS